MTTQCLGFLAFLTSIRFLRPLGGALGGYVRNRLPVAQRDPEARNPRCLGRFGQGQLWSVTGQDQSNTEETDQTNVELV